jgi:hypothetical protein
VIGDSLKLMGLVRVTPSKKKVHDQRRIALVNGNAHKDGIKMT